MSWLEKLERKQIRDETDRQMAEDYAGGDSIEAVSRKYNLKSRTRLYRALEKHGVPLRNKKNQKEFFAAKEQREMTDSELIKAVTAILGCNHYRMQI